MCESFNRRVAHCSTDRHSNLSRIATTRTLAHADSSAEHRDRASTDKGATIADANPRRHIRADE